MAKTGKVSKNSNVSEFEDVEDGKGGKDVAGRRTRRCWVDLVVAQPVPPSGLRPKRLKMSKMSKGARVEDVDGVEGVAGRTSGQNYSQRKRGQLPDSTLAYASGYQQAVNTPG